MRWAQRTGLVFGAIALASTLAAVLISWTALGAQFDNNVYDFLFRLQADATPARDVVVLAIDDRTLVERGGLRGLRRTLADVLNTLAAAPPKVVAIDVNLADTGGADDDAALSAAMARTRGLVLACEMFQDGSGWQDPPAPFRTYAEALGHVSTLPGPFDEINRRITLERVAGRQRRWALSLEAFRLSRNATEIDSSPTDVRVSALVIPSRWDEGRPMRVDYAGAGAIPQIAVRDLLARPQDKLPLMRGRVVFVGVTALSAIKDRLFTPLTPASMNLPMPGVEIHAQAFNTMSRGRFFVDTPLAVPVVVALVVSFAMAAAFFFLPGWPGYTLVAGLAVAAHAAPVLFFHAHHVLAPFAPVSAAWLSMMGCGVWQSLFVRRQLARSEHDRARYQQAFHFVAHELRTPLTAIQGSSELLSRYNMPDEKRKQLGEMINSESKRLARMITTFLDVERLSAGQMELRVVPFSAGELVESCLGRAAGLAERKKIRLESEIQAAAELSGDRELLEYALYNLITNAVKYSSSGTFVRIEVRRVGGRVEFAVQDQGIGMSQDEVKLLFRKFYRTQRAVQSGETGTGLGLSIVDQIVTHHGGRIQVRSELNRGSVFTMILPIVPVSRPREEGRDAR